MFRIHYVLIFLSCSLLLASEEENVLSISPEELSASIRKAPMPELGETRIEKILKNYYQKGLSGPENWQKIVSLNIIGKLKTEGGELELNAFQKKPDFIKMSLFPESGQNGLILAYDGEVAWKQIARRGEPERMAEAEARRFIHSARFGSYLLYPFAEGKRISLIDTVPVEGAICHQIRVELDTDYQVDYFIDIRNYLEIKVVNTDLRSKTTNSIIYKDYIRELGMPVARKVKSFENGKWVSTLLVDQVKMNSGVMVWMFHMPE